MPNLRCELPQRGPPCKLPLTEKVSLSIAAFKRPKTTFALLASLIAQTYENWEALVVHSDPGPETRAVVEWLGDPRIKFMEVPRASEFDYCAHCRVAGFQAATGEWCGTTNDDNLFAPVYFEWLLSAAKRDGADFVYCNMSHSITGWSAFNTSLMIGGIDAAGWLCRTEIVKRTPWPAPWHGSDGQFVVQRLVPQCKKITKVPAWLWIHN
ncbi:MAG: hypothetical protein A2W31_05010 [Planctomycetes bacterium RBG_16_64_10]|nr:MAG: hypothetical protein A2W31_05010 [Planctomycetes bacterium RBG_16_64_10]